MGQAESRRPAGPRSGAAAGCPPPPPARPWCPITSAMARVPTGRMRRGFRSSTSARSQRRQRAISSSSGRRSPPPGALPGKQRLTAERYIFRRTVVLVGAEHRGEPAEERLSRGPGEGSPEPRLPRTGRLPDQEDARGHRRRMHRRADHRRTGATGGSSACSASSLVRMSSMALHRRADVRLSEESREGSLGLPRASPMSASLEISNPTPRPSSTAAHPWVQAGEARRQGRHGRGAPRGAAQPRPRRGGEDPHRRAGLGSDLRRPLRQGSRGAGHAQPPQRGEHRRQGEGRGHLLPGDGVRRRAVAAGDDALPGPRPSRRAADHHGDRPGHRLRAQPRRGPPRPQAGEHPLRRAGRRHRQGDRLRPGHLLRRQQAHQPLQRHRDPRLDGHPELHGARAAGGRQERRPPGGHLLAGGDALRAAGGRGAHRHLRPAQPAPAGHRQAPRRHRPPLPEARGAATATSGWRI